MTSDSALAELLTLNCRIGQFGETIYTNSDGQLHRVHGPAVVYPNGSEFWFQCGQHHRIDGPASIYADGLRRWYLNHTEYTQAEWLKLVKDWPHVVMQVHVGNPSPSSD